MGASLLILPALPNHPCTRLGPALPALLPCPNPHSRLSHRPPAALPARHLPTRFPALALFSRRSPERVVRSSLPAAENLHKTGCERSQHSSLFILEWAGGAMSAVVQVFSRRQRRSHHTLRRPAAEKRQGTKSRREMARRQRRGRPVRQTAMGIWTREWGWRGRGEARAGIVWRRRKDEQAGAHERAVG